MSARSAVATPSTSSKPRKAVPGYSVGIQTANVLKVGNRLRRGLPFSALERLRNFSGLSREAIATVAQVPRRTLARRKKQGKLTSPESERLFRLAVVFEKAVDLFEGDVDAARQWLTSPAKAFAKTMPLEMCETEVGAREVENLIGRLEHGVFS